MLDEIDVIHLIVISVDKITDQLGHHDKQKPIKYILLGLQLHNGELLDQVIDLTVYLEDQHVIDNEDTQRQKHIDQKDIPLNVVQGQNSYKRQHQYSHHHINHSLHFMLVM